MQPRTWLYCEKFFVSPEFKQSGKPYLINRSNKESWQNNQPKAKPKKTFFEKFILPLMLPNLQKAYYEKTQSRKQGSQYLPNNK